jgi:cell division inhibitor SepF
MAGIFSQVSGWLGFDEAADSAPARSTSAGEQRPVRSVTPIRARRGVAAASEIFTIEPKSYEESKDIAMHFREGVSVIVNIGQLSESDSRNLLHFMLGLKEGLEGNIKRVTPKVYLLTPNHVEVNDEEESEPEGYADDLLVRPTL